MQIRVVPWSTEWCPTGQTLHPTYPSVELVCCGCGAWKASLPSDLQKREPEMPLMLNCVFFFFVRILYIMQNIGVCWSICRTLCQYTYVQIRIWILYRQLFQFAKLKVVLQTYVSTTAKLAKHREQPPVTPHLHHHPHVWPVQLSKGPLYCDQKWNHRSWFFAKRIHCGVVWGDFHHGIQVFSAIKMVICQELQAIECCCQVRIVDLGSLNVRRLGTSTWFGTSYSSRQWVQREDYCEISIPWKPVSISFMTVEEWIETQ